MGAEGPPASSRGLGRATAGASAGLVRRLASLGYETLLLSAIVLAGGFVAAPLVTPGGGAGQVPAVPGLAGRIAGFVLVFTLVGAWFVHGWSGGRRTLPMKTWRMRIVVADNHRPVSGGRALVRFLAAGIGPAFALAVYAVWPTRWAWALIAMNWAWALVDPDRSFMHDRIAGTRLVADQRPPG